MNNNEQKLDYKNRRIYGIPDKDYFFDNWIVIFFTLFWFTPIGILLLLRKISLHRRNLFKSGNISIVFGIFFIFIGFCFQLLLVPNNQLGIELALEPDEVELIIGFMLFNYITGAIILIIGILTKIKARRYRKYISLIVNCKTNDLTEISNKMRLSLKKVIKDLNILISKRYLERYVIDIKQNKIYLPEEVLERMKQEVEERKNQEKYIRPVQCKNCGANNLLKEQVGRCEYCNSYIK